MRLVQGSGFAHVARLLLTIALLWPATQAMAAEPPAKIGHVFVIVLENESFDTTFGPRSPAPYLARILPARGALLTRYYGIGHFSLDNYIAMISGQGPNPTTQSDCEVFEDFTSAGMTADGQEIGRGCVYPASVGTLAGQLKAAGLRWRGYFEDMGKDPKREAARCGHPVIGAPDRTQVATARDQYAARHNPFVYFHSIIDTPDCAANVLPLTALGHDLAQIADTPNLVFISPNLCHDGHDGGEPGKTCANGEPGGLISANRFLRHWVPEITRSPAFQRDGLLIITFDEADIDGSADPKGDSSACCGQRPGPNIGADDKIDGAPDRGPGITGPGGGLIGAVLVSRFIRPGTVSDTPYNHYSLLRSIEDNFALPPLGYAGTPGLKPFGADIFTAMPAKAR